MNADTAPLLQVNDLSIGFGDQPPIITDVNFSINRGETLALVGESGSGKTITCRSLLRVLPRAAVIHSGTAVFDPKASAPVDLFNLSEKDLRDVRGDRISMIFQEPMHSLSPLHRIGHQVAEVLTLHRGHSRTSAKVEVLEKFRRVGFVDPERAFAAYPFELSGGMRQRAMIAMAMIARPELLIADEPTTALDVTTQAQVLELIKGLQEETGMAVIFVTHDLGVVANIADQVCVLRKGRVMESGPTDIVIGAPAHGYTKKLLAAAPAIPHSAEPSKARPVVDPILQLEGINKTFVSRAGTFFGKNRAVQAVQNVSLTVERGKTFAIVGESGSGKSTVANIALGATSADAGGEIRYWAEKGALPVDVAHLDASERRSFQREAQMVFQDPFSSLSPRMQIIDILTEPLRIHGIGTRKEQKERAAELLEKVGLDKNMLRRFPHAFSGGQRQRLSIARALALNPSLLVCDEPTSALDLSVQMQVLELLEKIRDDFGLSYLFISHDLAVVARIADEVAVMRQGQIVEQAAPDVLFTAPRHPYTKALIAACLEADVSQKINLQTVALGAGDPHTWPEDYAMQGSSLPPLIETEPGHLVRVNP
ncbi:ABC transporter ATP-binding protein [Neptunicoccus cionae]|nr:ABC transporter ATP-binding protein [Amylibacter cionae]